LPSARIAKQGLMDEFVAAQAAIRALIDACWTVDINRTRFQNPFVKLLRFHLSGGLLVLMAHLRRHIWQAEQIAAAAPPARALSQPVA
jgi:cytochrome b561